MLDFFQKELEVPILTGSASVLATLAASVGQPHVAYAAPASSRASVKRASPPSDPYRLQNLETKIKHFRFFEKKISAQ